MYIVFRYGNYNPVFFLSVKKKGDLLVSGNADSTVKIWSLTTGQCLSTLSGPNRHMSAVTCLAFNDRYVVSSSDDGTVKLWSLETGEFVRNLLLLDSGGRGGVVWRISMNKNMLVCAVGSRIGVELTKLILLDFDWPPTNFLLSLAAGNSGSGNDVNSSDENDEELAAIANRSLNNDHGHENNSREMSPMNPYMMAMVDNNNDDGEND